MNQEFTIHSNYQLSDRVISQAVGEQIILMNPKTNERFSLDVFSSVVWQLMQVETNLAAVIALVAPRMGVPVEQLESDLLTFCEQLMLRGFLGTK